MTLVYEDSICGYEYGRSLSIYFISKDRYFYREYASDWFNCGFLNSDQSIKVMLDLSKGADMMGDLL